MSLVAYRESSSESEVEEGGEPEDEKKSDVRKLLGLLPPAKGGRSNKQPVRISLPTLRPGNSGSDEEEDMGPQVKRVRMGGASRLTALLPQPKAIPKQPRTGQRSLTTTQSMVPYTLSKRRQDSIKSEKMKSMKAKSRGKQGRLSAGGEGSDSDEEPVSFFSHLEETACRVADTTTAMSSSVVPSLTVLPTPLASAAAPTMSSTADSHRTHIHADSSRTDYSSLSSSSGPHISPNIAPSLSNTLHEQQHHMQSGGTQYSWIQYNANCAPTLGPEHSVSRPDNSATEKAVTAATSDGSGGDECEGGAGEVLGGAGPGVTIDQEALRRLAGGGMKRRGREDALNNIMDVLGDDVMEDARTYQRHYGEDPTITKLYKADKSKLKTPTGQQKRKHQITWLAHEAKERELELQKQWAASSQTRRDSRVKYGF